MKNPIYVNRIEIKDIVSAKAVIHAILKKKED